MGTHRHRALVLGSRGGVGRALLAVLHRTTPGRRLLSSLGALLLVDREPPDRHTPALDVGVQLPPTAIESGDDLRRLVRDHEVTQVIDVSSIDTVDCTQACDELGADFLCTSVEEWPGRRSMPTDEAIARLLPPLRPSLERRSHLVGSGANPGIVNALVFMALTEFANRAGVPATVDALELVAALITEEDTTVERNVLESADVFAMTWSPGHCLEELFEPAAFCARGGRVISLGHQPTARWYGARCGDRTIEGMAVPHEEVATLARHFPSVEIGFIYRIPAAARRALATHADRTAPDAWETRRLCPPWTRALTGSDRVGVLLCSRRFGELWVGFDTDVAKGLALDTNATQLQVAAGVLAGWTQLGTINGIHFVEDLQWEAFLRVVGEILGPPVIVHDASAPARSLAERCVTSSS
jgi:saccharopine dehydrogenase-like NADP-dependent oxidoreductase